MDGFNLDQVGWYLISARTAFPPPPPSLQKYAVFRLWGCGLDRRFLSPRDGLEDRALWTLAARVLGLGLIQHFQAPATLAGLIKSGVCARSLRLG